MIGKIVNKVIYALKYILKVLIFVLVGLMICLPFILKNTSFKGDDVVIFKNNINVMSLEGKANIKVLDSYLKTDIDYGKYTNYIKNYNKSGLVKKTFPLELYLIFIICETVCLYYAIKNIIKLFIDKEENEYMIYVNKKSFVINVISILAASLLRRFFFRNTMFASLDFGTFIFYVFIICMFIVVGKIVNMNKVVLLKEKKSEKYKESN